MVIRKTTAEQRAALDLTNLKDAVNCAEPVNMKTVRRFYAAFECAGAGFDTQKPSWGMAESTIGLTGFQPAKSLLVSNASLDLGGKVMVQTEESADTKEVVSCGRPLRGITIAIVHPGTRALLSHMQVCFFIVAHFSHER